MTRDLDLHGAAVALHRSYAWLQRHWRELARDDGFPLPFVGAERGSRPVWRAADIEAWKARRATGANHPATSVNDPQPALAAAPAAANDPLPLPRPRGDRAAALLAAAGA